MTDSKPTLPRRLWLQCAGLLLLLAVGFLLLREAGHRLQETLYPIRYADLVEEAAATYDVPISLVYAVIHTESEFDPDAVSSAEAKGLMQLTDETYHWALHRAGLAEEYAPEDLLDPAINIRYGVYVLSLLREQFPHTETLLAAYNAGQGHVREWLADPACSADGKTLSTIPYPETETYIKRVLSAREQYQSLYDLE
ncbi:MAG: lytic transglycosylase domain-containing protein [Clostridia bacterium]|nr:lytic transglycosylase domain-containing protein [Clostridia bacterium]